MAIESTPTGQLVASLGILNMTIREAQRDKDERWRNLIPQVRRINEELSKRSKASGVEPPPTVVSLRPAKMKARKLSLGNSGSAGVINMGTVTFLVLKSEEKNGRR